MSLVTIPVFLGENLVGVYRGVYTEESINKQTGQVYQNQIMGFAREYVDKFGQVATFTDTAIVSKALVEQGFPHLMNQLIGQLVAVPIAAMSSVGSKDVKNYIRQEALAMFQQQPVEPQK